ncbi:hypothetical protein VNO77_05185 [Canavalia gladiata]|uniref:Uncharacterized protein n=1 Tax=Canavalia gladiata TaxID=3824 RepID=A0AAN9MZX3_CANGL
MVLRFVHDPTMEEITTTIMAALSTLSTCPPTPFLSPPPHPPCPTPQGRVTIASSTSVHHHSAAQTCRCFVPLSPPL